LLDRSLTVPGVLQAREFVYHTVQRQREDGRPLRMALMGLSWPLDKGEWIPLTAGRSLGQGHFELIADESLRLPLGAELSLGKDVYRVVGLTRHFMSSSGDGIAFVTAADATAIQFDSPGEAVRLERAARSQRGQAFELARQQPTILENADRPARELPAIARPQANAVMVSVAPGAEPEAVADILRGWPDVSVFTHAEQVELLVEGSVDKIKRQIGLFRVLLTIIVAIIMALILYTLTLDKLHSIALLKLIGAPNRVILAMILQQALVLGGLGFAIAWSAGWYVFPWFPRRVIVTPEDVAQLGGIVLVISVVSSGLGIWRAFQVSPNEALA
jgi:putative ABC transport system permease protein